MRGSSGTDEANFGPNCRPLEEKPLDGDWTEDKKEKDRRVDVLDKHLVGLAFSGGGIRSATFNIGVLQGASRSEAIYAVRLHLDCFRRRIRGRLARRLVETGGDVRSVGISSSSRVRQQESDRVAIGPKRVVDQESEPLHHLRAYSDYLAPWMGLFTADSWTLAIYLRNTLTNLLLAAPDNGSRRGSAHGRLGIRPVRVAAVRLGVSDASCVSGRTRHGVLEYRP